MGHQQKVHWFIPLEPLPHSLFFALRYCAANSIGALSRPLLFSSSVCFDLVAPFHYLVLALKLLACKGR